MENEQKRVAGNAGLGEAKPEGVESETAKTSAQPEALQSDVTKSGAAGLDAAKSDAAEVPKQGPLDTGSNEQKISQSAAGNVAKAPKKINPMMLLAIVLGALLVVAIIIIVILAMAKPEKTAVTDCSKEDTPVLVLPEDDGDDEDGEDGADYNVADIPFQIRNMNGNDTTIIFPIATNEYGTTNYVTVQPEIKYNDNGQILSGTDNHKRFSVELQGGSELYGLDEERDTLTGVVSFKQDVRTVQVCELGQAVGNEFVAFVMADGMVNYLPIYGSMKNGELIVEEVGNVSGIVNIVRGGYQGIDFLFQRLDGGYYSAWSLLGNKLEMYWQGEEE